MCSMLRVRTSWLLGLPLMAGGSLSAHAAGYRLALPDVHDRARGLQLTGHSYLEHLPLLVALIAAPTLVAFALAAFGAVGRRPRIPGPWAFALLPPLSFVLQEHLERLIHSGAFPWGASLERTFALGLLLQAPFALIAFLLARGMLAGIRVILRALARRPPRHRVRTPRRPFGRPQVDVPRLAALALGHAERGPPLPARF